MLALREEMTTLKEMREKDLNDVEVVRSEKDVLSYQLSQLKEDFSFVLESLTDNGIETNEKVSNSCDIILPM